MRKLVWFTVGYTAAIGLCAYLLSPIMAAVAAMLLGILTVVLFRWGSKILPKVICLGLCVGTLIFCGYDMLVLSKARVYDSIEADLTVTATDYSFDNGSSQVVDGKVTLQGIQMPIRMYYESPIQAKPGDRLQGRMALRYTPGGEKKATFHQAEGILLLASAQGQLQYQPAEDSSLLGLTATLRRNLSRRITELFPRDSAAFAKAFLLGMDEELSFQQNDAFQKSGIRHVIAVSGLHVSILFAALYLLTGRKPLLLLLLGLPLLILFAAVAGFTPSVVRACIMQAMIILALVLNREYDLPTSLAFSVLVMLTVNPLAVTSVSLQLSVGCMIGIIGFSRPIAHYLQDEKRLGTGRGKSLRARLTRTLVGSLSVSLGSMAVTMPLCAIHFGVVSLLGILGNLVVLWVLSFVFYGIAAACLLSTVWFSLGKLVAWVSAWGIRYVLWSTELIGRIPVGVLYTDSPYIAAWCFLTCLVIGIAILAKTKKPMLTALVCTVLLVFCCVAGWLEPQLDSVRLTVLDVGQGQCILLQSRKQVYLIDCGGTDPEDTAIAARNAMGVQGVNRLDGVILTHYDEDHVNGMEYLLQIVDVESLYLPDTPDDSGVRQMLENSGIPIRWITRQTTLTCETGELCLYPATETAKGNESSMCILFQGETCDILVTGDRDLAGETALMAEAALPDVEVLIAGHHGSGDSTGTALLQQIRPEIVVISVGAGNLHGHPDSQMLSRTAQLGCIIRRTDLEGTIIIRG